MNPTLSGTEDLRKEQSEPVGTQGPLHQTAAGNSSGERPIEQPHTPTPASSDSATESLSTYAERTVETILARDELNVTSTFPGASNQAEGLIGTVSKSSKSEKTAIKPKVGLSSEQRDRKKQTTRAPEDAEELSVITIPATKDLIDPAEYFTDTSEVEEVMNSSGLGGPVVSQGKDGSLFVKVPIQSEDILSGGESPNESPGSRQGHSQEPRRLSASGHTLLRKYFTEKDPIVLPRGHPTIALTEGQMHTVLKTISDETILSSFHLMKSLLLQATSGKVLTKQRSRHAGRTSHSLKGPFSSSGDESTHIDSSNEGHTSAAVNTDDEPGSLSFCFATEEDHR